MLPPRQVRGTDDIDEVVRYRTTDLTRLTQISKIVTKVERREMDVRAAAAASADAVGARHPYPRWVASAAWAGLAAAVALLLGGHPLSAMTAFVVTALIDRLGRPLARWGVARFFLQMVGALVGTVATLALLALGVLPPGPEPSLVIAAGITVLLSGLSVVGAVPDAISGFYVTAAGRAAEIALLSAGLLAGVIVGRESSGRALARSGRRGGRRRHPARDFDVRGGRCRRDVLAGLLRTGARPVCSGVDGRGRLGRVRLSHVVRARWTGVSTGIAASLVGIATAVSWRGPVTRPLVIILPGMVPLLPGLTAYRGFYQLAAGNIVGGVTATTSALAIGLALAAGVAPGELRRPTPSRIKARSGELLAASRPLNSRSPSRGSVEVCRGARTLRS